jgi:hypothetical protein
MTISDAQINKIVSFVRGYIIRTAQLHGHQNALYRANARWMHTLNVLKNVELIADGEKSSQESCEICRVAALFHDIDHYTVQNEYHAARGAETTTRFLTKEGYDPLFIKRVAAAVRDHDRDLNDEEPIPEQVARIVATLSIESRMVLDADTLDKIGVSNILQAVTSMSLTEKRHVADVARELTSGWPLQRAKLWKELLTTPTGRQMGEQRFAFYEQFLTQIAGEIVMYDPYPEVRVTQEVAQIERLDLA